MTTYEQFIAKKAIVTPPSGLAEVPELNPALFPFQRDIVAWALRRGRAAIFADTGLGKTAMQLEWARVVCDHLRAAGGNPRVLILAPLAVSQQTVREGAKFGIEVRYCADQSEVRDGITITNYERLGKFDRHAFGGVVLDESSILKSFMGATKRALVDAFAETPYRLACTATPAPNDHLELGNHSEFLGVLTSHEMLARWFLPDTSTFGTYRLKGHAVVPFWDWVSSWARCIGKPSDMGAHYSDAGYVLPGLEIAQHGLDVDVTTDRGALLFRVPEMSATAVHKEKRRTVQARAAKVAELVAAEPSEPWLIWCETDYEADALTALLPEACEVRGSDSLEAKESGLLGFADGAHRVLITKAKIAGFGLNFQRCARVAFVGPTFSYESFYQSIRRCYRFGQRRHVIAHVVMGKTESGVFDVMLRKAADHESMKAEMFNAARRAQAKEDERKHAYRPTVKATFPAWLHSGPAPVRAALPDWITARAR